MLNFHDYIKKEIIITAENSCWDARLLAEFFKEKKEPMRIYLAGPIFFYGDYLRNIEWANKIREAFPTTYVYSPVENTDINGVEGKKKFGGSQEIANGDNIRLDNTDVLIACIDGAVFWHLCRNWEISREDCTRR